MVMNLLELSMEQKAHLFDRLVERMDTINRKCGTIVGTIQILEDLEKDAIRCGYKKCPHCGR